MMIMTILPLRTGSREATCCLSENPGKFVGVRYVKFFESTLLGFAQQTLSHDGYTTKTNIGAL